MTTSADLEDRARCGWSGTKTVFSTETGGSRSGKQGMCGDGDTPSEETTHGITTNVVVFSCDHSIMVVVCIYPRREVLVSPGCVRKNIQ